MAIGVAKFITAMNTCRIADSDHAQCGICTPPRRLEMAGSIVALHAPILGNRWRSKGSPARQSGNTTPWARSYGAGLRDPQIR